MELRLEKNKVTKNSIVRYGDSDNHNIYLTPDEVQELGNPTVIKVSIEASQSRESKKGGTVRQRYKVTQNICQSNLQRSDEEYALSLRSYSVAQQPFSLQA